MIEWTTGDWTIIPSGKSLFNAPYILRTDMSIRLGTHRVMREDPVIAGPFETLEAAFAAYLVLFGGKP